MSKTIVGILVAFLVVLALVLPRNKPNSSNQAITYGVILPLSGPVAGWGEDVKAGFDLAYSELPTETKSKIKLVYEDNQLDPSKTVSAYQKLITTDNPEVLFVMSSNAANAIADQAEAKKLPTLALSFDSKTSANKNYILNFFTPIRTYVSVVCNEMKSRGYKKVYLTTVNNDGGIIFSDEVLKQCGDFIMNKQYDKYPIGENDFRTSTLKIKEQQPDAIIMNLLGGQLGKFAKDARLSGYKGNLIGNDVSEDLTELEVSEGAMEGMWYVAPADYSESYKAKINVKYPGRSPLNSVIGYDALKIIAAAAEKNKNDADDINTYLHRIKNFKGEIGIYSATDQNDFSMPAVIKTVKNGQFVKIK